MVMSSMSFNMYLIIFVESRATWIVWLSLLKRTTAVYDYVLSAAM
jgi:hypothetical protein